MSDRISAPTVIGLVSGYLFSATGIYVVNLSYQANQPNIFIVKSFTAVFALISAVLAIALLRRRQLALRLTKAYFSFQLVISVSLFGLVLFGYISREYHGMSLPGLTINVLFAASFIFLL